MARSRTLGLPTLLVAVAVLAACDADSPDPTAPGGPEGPDPSVVALESNQLDSGGTGVVVSDGFVGLELEPAIDDEGTIIPDRWTNLRVAVGGTEVDVRRLDERTMEFTVPILPGGTYGVDVASPLAHGSISARVFGVIASEPVGCVVVPASVTLIPVGNALYFDTECWMPGMEQQGVGVTWPAVPGRGFEWLPEGEMAESALWASAGPSHRPNHFVARRSGASTEFWVWEAGPNPRPVEPLDCFATADDNREFTAPAEAGDGSCLLIDPSGGVMLRDGAPVAEWPGFTAGHLVVSDDGWLTARNAERLIVFDAAGELVVEADMGLVRDARFAPGGGPLYVAVEDGSAAAAGKLLVVDRATGDVRRERIVTGTIHAVAVSEDRLWIARSTGPRRGGELFVELLDSETLETRRSIAVSGDLVSGIFPFPYHGVVPVLLQDATGRRLSYTGLPFDQRGMWSHVVDVGEIE